MCVWDCEFVGLVRYKLYRGESLRAVFHHHLKFRENSLCARFFCTWQHNKLTPVVVYMCCLSLEEKSFCSPHIYRHDDGFVWANGEWWVSENRICILSIMWVCFLKGLYAEKHTVFVCVGESQSSWPVSLVYTYGRAGHAPIPFALNVARNRTVCVHCT